MIRCHVLGNPLPNITWYKGDTVSGSRLDHREKQWIIKANESETYLCLAKNLLGTATARVDVVGKSVIRICLSVQLAVFNNCSTRARWI